MISSQEQKKRTDLWERKSQELDAKLRASGRTVTEALAPSDGPEYRVVFPANRESASNPSESPSNTSTALNSAPQDPMAPAVRSLEQGLDELMKAANPDR